MFGSLLALVAVVIGLFTTLLVWGGQVEVTLLVFGNPVFVVIDGGNPRVLFVLTLPIALILMAIRIRTGPVQR